MSPLDALADGVQAKALGLTQRLQDVAERYAIMLAAAPAPFTLAELEYLAEVFGRVVLPSPADAAWAEQFGAAVVRFADGSPRKALAKGLRQLGAAQRVRLLERLEEMGLDG